MRFTFGIVTTGNPRVPTIIKSINDNVPNPEIIVVGGEPNGGAFHIPFDENMRPAWITLKKSIITHAATNENIVYMHDYMVLTEGWYEGFLKFGDDFDVCMNVITNLDGTRYRDWVDLGLTKRWDEAGRLFIYRNTVHVYKRCVLGCQEVFHASKPT